MFVDFTCVHGLRAYVNIPHIFTEPQTLSQKRVGKKEKEKGSERFAIDDDNGDDESNDESLPLKKEMP